MVNALQRRKLPADVRGFAASVLICLLGANAVHGADDRFGVMTHFAQGWDPSWTRSVADLGLSQTRDELYWSEIETKKGVFTFPAAYDRYMAELASHHVSPLIVLSFGNKNYDDNETPYTDEGFEAYARYAVEVLRHYGTQIKAVEVWNEYNGSFTHGPASFDRAETYRKMLEVVYTAIKRERPDVTVVAGGTAGVPLPYWEKMLKSGALPFMDAISVHPYRYDLAPEGIEEGIAELQLLVRRYNGGKDKPVWVTESGWYLKGSKAPGDLKIDEETQARFLARSYALLLSTGVERVYWYLLRDDQGFDMGLFDRAKNARAKPAYHAMATLVRQLSGAHFVRREESVDSFYSLLFQRDSGEEVRVIWSLEPRSLPLTATSRSVNLQGAALPPGSILKIDDSPVFVTGPVRGIPAAPKTSAKVIANSARDFQLRETSAWSYGCFVAPSSAFVPLTVYEVTDWKASWTASFPYLEVSVAEQHPSVIERKAVTAVRRWKSDINGEVDVRGTFRCTTNGDGVGVSICVNGTQQFRKLIGGTEGGAIVETFDFIEKVRPGTVIDFCVDPGPGININYDATAVTVAISTHP